MAIPEKLRIKINVLAFLVIALLLIAAMATQVLSVFEGRYTVTAEFVDAGGVFTNQEVTYRGVTVGQVGDMRVIEDGVAIDLMIRDEYDIPAEDVEARVMFKSAVGEQFVDILPADDGEPFLEDGDKIPMEQTDIPVSTQELLTTLEAVLRGVPPEDLKNVVDTLGVALTGRGQDLATIIESMADLADVFAERAPEVEGILRDGTKVGDAFLASREDFTEAIRQLVIVSEILAGSTGELERLLSGTNAASDEVVSLLRTYRQDVDQVIIDLAEINELQADHKGDLNQLFEHLPTGLNKVTKAFEPKTGLVRFGLVTDTGAPACSYGTPRRPPHNRKNQKPPQNVLCGGKKQGGGRSSDTPPSVPDENTDDTTDLSSVIDDLDDLDAPTLPARMSDWSWSLLYLNGL